ncbi:hypothetical protein Trydic_g13264 [Trypoxylus dichotomus]
MYTTSDIPKDASLRKSLTKKTFIVRTTINFLPTKEENVFRRRSTLYQSISISHMLLNQMQLDILTTGSSWCSQNVPFMDAVKNPQLVHKDHRVCHVHFHDEDRASKSYLKKNAVPSLFLPVPTVDGKEKPNGVDGNTCNMANKSKSGEALIWESFCEAVTSVATSIDCCKTSVRVTHGMVTDSSIILLEVLVPGPRAITCNILQKPLRPSTLHGKNREITMYNVNAVIEYILGGQNCLKNCMQKAFHSYLI